MAMRQEAEQRPILEYAPARRRILIPCSSTASPGAEYRSTFTIH
jgi:hypothetical protein